MYIQRQVFIYAIFAIIPKSKSDWSHSFLLTKYVKRLDIHVFTSYDHNIKTPLPDVKRGNSWDRKGQCNCY